MINACSQSDKKADKVLSPEELTRIKEQQAWESSSNLVKNITHSSKGLIRGVSWGQSLTNLKETVELSEVQPSQGKSFTQYLDDSDLNFVDITYLQNDKQLIHEITLDIFLEDKKEVTQLITDLKDYFNLKFGESNRSGSKVIWSNYKNTRIDLEDVSTSKDPGIKVIFKKVD
ncbi:hypothetical protein V7S79_09815 [Aquirufa sp. ROCK-SH2]